MKVRLPILIVFLALPLQSCVDRNLVEVEKDAAANLLHGKSGQELLTAKHNFAILARVDESFFAIDIRGTGGTIHVAWGDGTSTDYHLSPAYGDTQLYHDYAQPGLYLVHITGDIKHIFDFSSYYGYGPFDEINIRGLTGLKYIQVGLTHSSAVVDLSENVALETVSFVGLNELRSIILPKKHNIRFFELAGPFALDDGTLDSVISNIYYGTVKNRTFGGYLILIDKWYEYEPVVMLGPPSASGMDQLLLLQNLYQWNIIPGLSLTNPVSARK